MVNEQLAAGKRQAKDSRSGIGITRLPESGVAQMHSRIERLLER
jgi:hypothetical protein